MALDPRSVQFKTVSPAVGTTDVAVVAAVPGRKIRLMSFGTVPAATPAATIQFTTKPSGGGTAISPAYPLTAATLLAPAVGEGGICETNAGEGLSVTTGAGTNASPLFVQYLVL